MPHLFSTRQIEHHLWYEKTELRSTDILVLNCGGIHRHESVPRTENIMENAHIVSLKNIEVSFIEGHPILQDLSLTVHKGESIAVLGPGGCGKSTLLKVILGIVKYQRGSLSLFGKPVETLSGKEREGINKRIGMAFQQGALFDFMTVRENILFAMENMTTLPKAECEERVKRLLAEVELPDAADKLPSELSGGMRRRVGIVRAMVTNPELALLDEPAAGLDPVTSSVVIDMIHRIGRSVQASMVCVTSNADVAFRFASKVGILKDGKIVGLGTKEELLNLNDDWITKFLTLRAAHDSL